jgi:Ca2+-binding RTX toxin-like protein
MNDTVSGGVLVDLITYENVYVKQGVSAGSIGDTAVEGSGGYHSVEVFGDLFGTNYGIRFDDGSNSVNSQILVGATGSVTGMAGGIGDGRTAGTGILIFGVDNRINNHGFIYGDDTAIQMNSSTGDNLKAFALSDENSLIINRGEIQGSNIAINHQANEMITVRNHGTIDAGQYAIAGGDNVERVVNRGAIVGNVDLGGGNDVYDGRKSGTVDGRVDGGLGADILYGGSDDDQLAGSYGKDTLLGGAGSDTFLFDTSITGGMGSADAILDFDPNHDTIALDHNIFSAIRASDFERDPREGTFLNGHIIFGHDGTLGYRASSANPALWFAHLQTTHLALTNADFVLV